MRYQLGLTYYPIASVFALAALLLLLNYLPFSWAKKFGLKAKGETATSAIDVSSEPQGLLPMPQQPEVELDQLVVRELNNGLATLLMRERTRFGKCTAHLIVWAGKRRKGKKVLVEDSHYDLGFVDGADLKEEVIALFVASATTKLGELVVEGMKKQRRKKDAPAAESPATADVTEAVIVQAASTPEVVAQPQQAAVAIEENVKPEAAIKLRRYPSVFRGKVLEMGLMPRNTGGEDFKCYGVRYRTPEGVEDVVWGVNLRTAFHEAGASVNDEVEILKIGRKTVEEGKAPMNMYKVTKLSPQQQSVQ